jgi:hypothetical protein
MRNFIVYIKYCYGDEIKEGEMGRACGTGGAINAYTFLLKIRGYAAVNPRTFLIQNP